jgi:hypothetical protein
MSATSISSATGTCTDHSSVNDHVWDVLTVVALVGFSGRIDRLLEAHLLHQGEHVVGMVGPELLYIFIIYRCCILYSIYIIYNILYTDDCYSNRPLKLNRFSLYTCIILNNKQSGIIRHARGELHNPLNTHSNHQEINCRLSLYYLHIPRDDEHGSFEWR